MSGLQLRTLDCGDDVALMSEFNEVFKQLTDAFVDHIKQDMEITNQDLLDRVSAVFTYNVLGARDLSPSTSSFKAILPDVFVVAWCVEILQACFLVADDVMDHSLTRRGKKCWYKVEGIDYDAVNDSLILNSGIYALLKRFCSNKTFYYPLMELFLDVSLKTEMGQMIDCLSDKPVMKFEDFCMERWLYIVDYKTAFYTFYLPFACAMILTDNSSLEQLKSAKQISIELGRKFQAQDDYLDCFGDPGHIGKIGTDIQDSKCSWLLITALEIATDEQRVDLQTNLGTLNIAPVKAVYEELSMSKLFDDFETTSYIKISSMIEQSMLNHRMFYRILDKIHKRTK